MEGSTSRETEIPEPASDARFIIYERGRPAGERHHILVEHARADDVDAARLAVRTIAGDHAEEGAVAPLLGIYDRAENEWPLWPWGCAECSRALPLDRHYRCSGCRRDRALGEPYGTTNREDEEGRYDMTEEDLVRGWAR